MRVTVVFPYRPTCPHREAAYETVRAWWAVACPEFDQLVADDGGDPFSRGGSLNQGVAETGSDVIVAADADILIGRAQILAAVELAAAAPGLVQPFTRLHWYDAARTRALLTAPHRAFAPGGPSPTYRWNVSPTTPLLGGLNVLSRETWERAGRWLAAFRGWGHEDIAFAAQCRTLVAPHRKVEGTVHHLFHPKPVATPYASETTIARNTAAMEAVAAADGDPEAMRTLVGV